MNDSITENGTVETVERNDRMADMAERLATLKANSPSKPSRRQNSGFGRWGNTEAIEQHVQIVVSKSICDEFRAKFPIIHRRAGADAGIRWAIDHADEILKFKESTR